MQIIEAVGEVGQNSGDFNFVAFVRLICFRRKDESVFSSGHLYGVHKYANAKAISDEDHCDGNPMGILTRKSGTPDPERTEFTGNVPWLK